MQYNHTQLKYFLYISIGSNICDCLNTTGKQGDSCLILSEISSQLCILAVRVNATANADKYSVTIQVFCDYTLVLDFGLKLTIIVNGSGQIESKSIMCTKDKPVKLLFGSLQKNTLYSSSVLWIANDKMAECTSITTLNFKTKGNF